MMDWCDKNSNVLRWAYEPYSIEYNFCKPPHLPDWVEQLVDNKTHKYYIDFLIEIKDNAGNVKMFVIEIKPERMTKEPKEPKRKTRASILRYVNDMKEYAKNCNKWDSAEKFCARKGYQFKLLTEKNLFS